MSNRHILMFGTPWGFVVVLFCFVLGFFFGGGGVCVCGGGGLI